MLRNSPSKIYKFIIDEQTILGGNKKAFLANTSLWIIPILGLRNSYFLLLAISVHFFIVISTRQDPQFFQIMLKKIKQKKRYSPWMQDKRSKNKKPDGFGKNTLC